MTTAALPRVALEGVGGEWLPAERWVGSLTSADESVLSRVDAPVLDVGCGPGRHVLALAERGIVTLGIDVTPGAIGLARGRGAPVLERSVFDRVPGSGRWASVLLLDGNVGIGGDPPALLARVTALLAPQGHALVELDPPERSSTVDVVRLRVDGVAGPWFAWARVGAADIHAVAAESELVVTEEWTEGDRWFAALTRREPRWTRPDS
jgi:SAM-dependent methyltransferase